MTPEETMALKANQNNAFKTFYAIERILEVENDPFKVLKIYERYERQIRVKKLA